MFAVPRFEKPKNRKEFFEQRVQSLGDDSAVKAVWLSFIGFTETLFAYHDFSRLTSHPAVLNRHLLLHGRDIPQARIENCLSPLAGFGYDNRLVMKGPFSIRTTE